MNVIIVVVMIAVMGVFSVRFSAHVGLLVFLWTGLAMH